MKSNPARLELRRLEIEDGLPSLRVPEENAGKHNQVGGRMDQFYQASKMTGQHQKQPVLAEDSPLEQAKLASSHLLFIPPGLLCAGVDTHAP